MSHCSYSNKLLCDAIFRTNLHLSQEYTSMRIYIGWLLVEINLVTMLIPISTLAVSCTVTTALIIVIIWSGERYPIIVESMAT